MIYNPPIHITFILNDQQLSYDVGTGMNKVTVDDIPDIGEEVYYINRNERCYVNKGDKPTKTVIQLVPTYSETYCIEGFRFAHLIELKIYLK